MAGKDIKRLILGLLTLVVVALLGGSLFSSLGETQITDRIQLYQTDLLLSASELKSDPATQEEWSTAQTAILGDNPVEAALKEYQEVRQSAQTTLNQLNQRLQQLSSHQPQPIPKTAMLLARLTNTTGPAQEVQTAIHKQESLINQLDLRIGLLQAKQNTVPEALKTWNAVIDRAKNQLNASDASETATVLVGLWSDPPRLLPNAEPLLQKQLDGWFRYQSLARLYQLQQRSDALAALEAAEQEVARSTLVKLALVGTLPAIGGVFGAVLIIALIVQWFLRGKQALLAENTNLAWEVPWDWETIGWVLIVGFFCVGQIVIPLLTGWIGVSFAAFGTRAKAAYTLTYYLLMAGGGLLVLYLSIKRFFPLPEGWFRLTGKRNWLLWGLGGYLVALPLMFGVSLVNQLIWNGQGGSNPLLQIVLEEGDSIALSIFFFTAAIAAPVFEELLFRGFLLASLTRYLPSWGAIGLSSLIFAMAHLSVSEVLPLFVLGCVLGFVYTRSRSLLAPMLLHSLWNSVTMIGLFILGSGTR